MRKVIVYPVGIWTERLLPIDSLNYIDYFISDNVEDSEHEVWHGKPVYTIAKLKDESPDEVIIIIADSKYYKSISGQLNQMGFAENKHYFNGWHLSEHFFLAIKENEWQRFEKADTFDKYNWNARAASMATLIPEDVHSIIDFGCGNQRLKNYLRPDIRYIGLDYIARDENTIVCDVNKESLPQIDADCIYMAGFLMYVKNLESFLKQINTRYILLSYEGREVFDTFGIAQSRGMLPCIENYKNTWEIIQGFLDSNYNLVKISGRDRETYCLFRKLE